MFRKSPVRLSRLQADNAQSPSNIL